LAVPDFRRKAVAATPKRIRPNTEHAKPRRECRKTVVDLATGASNAKFYPENLTKGFRNIATPLPKRSGITDFLKRIKVGRPFVQVNQS